MSALPAAPATVACYVGHLFGQGTVRGGSIRPYVAAIAAQHRRSGFSDPTQDPLVTSTRRGYLANDAARSAGPPMRSAPLPAACAEQALMRALAASSRRDMQRWGVVALGFLLCARPTSLRMLRGGDVQFRDCEVTIQMVHFKYGESGSAPRIALRIPVSPPADPVYRLLRALSVAAGPHGYLFTAPRGSAPMSAAALRSSLGALVKGRPPPAGTKFTARSLRSGGISAAYSAGVRLEVIMRLSNHTSAEVVHKHYLDALLPVSASARLFFGRFAPPAAIPCQPATSHG